MVRLTGLSVFLVAEVLRPGSLPKKSAVVGVVVAVRLMMITFQNSEIELPLCSQVKVMSPPTGTAYPPGTRVPSAEKVTTTGIVSRQGE